MTLDMRRALAGALLLGLTACDLTYPWTSTHAEVPWASVDTTPVTVRTPLDATAAPSIALVVTSNAPDFHVAIEGNALVMPYGSGPFRDRAELNVPLTAPSGLGVGTHQAAVVIHVFVAGQHYWEEVGGPLAVPLTYEVAPPNFAAVSPESLTIAAHVAGAPVSTPVQIDGPAEGGPWTATIEDDPTGWLTLAPTGGDTLPATLTATGTPAEAGGFGATVVLRRGPSERRVSASFWVHDPPPTWSGGTVNLAAISYAPALPDPTTIDLGTETGAPCAITWVFVQYTWPNYGWLDASAPTSTAPGPLRLAVTTTALVPGRYEASVEVACGWETGHGVIVPVALDVGAGDLAYPLDQLWFTIEQATTPEQATHLVPLTAARPGVGFEAWTEGGWLAVSPASGTVESTGALTVTVDRVALATGFGGNREGAVVVRHREADGTAIERRIPAMLWLNLQGLERIAPRAISAAAPGAVTVAASCDSSWPVMFDDTPAPALTCEGTLAHATVPALAPGPHDVWIQNGLGIRRLAATLTVLTPAPRSAAGLASPGPLARLFFDDVRGVLWAASTAPGRLQRWTGSDGWSAAGLDLPGLHDAFLRDDGAAVYALAGGNAVRVDPLTFATTPAANGLVPPESWGWRWTLVPTWPRQAWTVTGEVSGCAAPETCSAHLLWMDDYNFLLAPTGVPLSGATGAPSDDLSRALLARHGLGTPQPIAAWDPVNGLRASLPPDLEATSVSLDRTGDRALLLDEAAAEGATATILLDRDLAPLPGALPGTTAAAILSHDGTRAFTFDGVARTVRAFDLAAAPVDGLFVELGTGIAPAADPGAGVVLAVAVDDRTLFVGGDANVAVVPLP